MDPVFDLIIRASLGLLFVVAAWHKLRDPRRFAATLGEYRLLPARFAPAAATCVVLAELGTVVALVRWPRGGATAAAALLAVYGSAIAINLARGRRHIDCGCGGPAARREIGAWMVARNALVAIAALAAAVLPMAAREMIWLDACTIVGATAMLAACWTATDHLVTLAPRLARLREAG
jgi:hypothetical protein